MSFRFPTMLTCLLVCSIAPAKESCGVEVKLLLDPAQQAHAVKRLAFAKETKGNVFFYDTKDLALLDAGLILRVRSGGEDNDITVKIRPSTNQEFTDPSNGTEDFKCEMDQNESGTKPSFSLKIGLTDKPPKSGTELREMLSEAQRKLVDASGASFEWSDVLRIGAIQAVSWERKKSKKLPKVALEAWEWSGKPRILEVSTKTEPADADKTLEKLKSLLNSKEISLAAESKPKTRTALEELKPD